MNEQVLNNLPAAQYDPNITAYLQDETGKQYFVFQYNPESQEDSRQAVYSSPNVACRSVQPKQYTHTEGRVRNFPNLLMESWAQRKSLRPLLDEIQSLMVADVEAGKYAPPVLYFSFGSERFGPAVLTNFKSKIELVVGGEPASARVDLTLEEIPPLEVPPQATTTSATLTNRQTEEGVAKAEVWLRTNTRSLPTNIRPYYLSKRYSLVSSSNGEIQILNNRSKALGVVGTYNGRTFTPSLTA